MRLVGYVFLLGCAVPSMKVGAFSMLPTRGPFPGLVGLPQQRSVSRIARAMPLRMANQFDIAKPVFDLLSLRSVRGDALVRYDALNQSEPLRIALYAVLSFSFFSAPSISETIGYDEMNLPATITSYAMATFSVGLLYRECNRRAKQLKRIEKELNSELLEVRLPTNPLADRPYTKPVTLKALRALSNPPRIIALSGTSDRLEEALKGLSMLGRRLQQARVFVVIVPTDGSKPSDFEALGPVSPKSWLVEASDQSAWQDYFRSLSADDDAPIPSFQWFGLNSSGKSFGSGQDIPLWLQVLGQHLRPIEFLDESDLAAEKIDATLLTSLNSFYDALTTGSLENINDIFSKQTSSQVSEVRSSLIANSSQCKSHDSLELFITGDRRRWSN